MRTQILSYGGGVQTAGMIAAILLDKLPRPDMLVIADTAREKSSTWDYLAEVIDPALERENMTVEIASHDLSTVDLYAHNDDLLIPVYTRDESMGTVGKLPTFCSNEWKQRVIMRWARAQGVEQCDIWIGFSTDEAGRAKPSGVKWFARRFPLLELGMSRADCRVLIEEMGWPMPYKSACKMCPNMNDAEWVEMRDNYPNDFAAAIVLEDEIREWDENVYLHSSAVPLREVEWKPENSRSSQASLQCGLGLCWV